MKVSVLFVFAMNDDLKKALAANQDAFGVALTESQTDRLSQYYEFVQEHNPLLHLVGPCAAEEFAIRHTLESLTLLKHLPQEGRFADIGPGGGLPSIPCLIVREDLRATLIESKEKKAKFLNEATDLLGLTDRAKVVNRQFAETQPGGARFVTCRALDKLTDRLPALLKWAGRRPLFLFGGENLAAALQKAGRSFVQELTPLSERRFLFVVNP